MDRFILGISLRIVGVVVLTGTLVNLYLSQVYLFWLFPIGIVHIALCINLYRYVTGLNRKLTRFL